MLRSLCLALLLTVSANAGAQTPSASNTATSVAGSARVASSTIGFMQGTVIGEDTGTALATATVSVWTLPDSSLVTGAIADADGRFVIERLNAGRYFVQVSFVGYAPFRSDAVVISRDTPRIDFNQIGLSPEAAMMTGVEVTAERAEVSFEIDRTVYNTRDQIASKGGNSTDLLQNIPSVEVDVDGNVSLRGNQSVAILINGKPAPARGDFLTTFLQQIPADLIERVEVIPNPSAKFDPEGMAGMINIVLKEGTEMGTSGGVTLSAGTASEYNASGSLNIQKGKMTLFSNYGFRTDDRSSSDYNFRENRFLDPLSFLEQDANGSRSSMSHVGSINMDYALTKQSTFSVSGLISRRDGDSNGLNRYEAMDLLSDPTERFDRLSVSEGAGTNMDFSTSFRRIVTPSRNELTAELRFNRSVNDDLDAFEERQIGLETGQITDIRELSNETMDVREDELTGQVDWIRPIGSLKLETGYRGNLRSMDNTLFAQFMDKSGSFTADVQRNNAFQYQEQVHAGYALLSGKLGIFDVQGGLRVEQALTNFDLATTGESFDNSYGSFFPSGVISWKPSAMQQVKVSYSKRVRRPRTGQLNPFTNFSDPLNLYAGNPFLQPEYTHAFELGIQRFSNKGSLSITPYFRRSVNEIERFKTIESDGTSITTFRNFDQSDSYGAEVVGSMRFGRSFSGFASFNGYRVVTDAASIDANLANDALSWSARANLSWNVREGLDMQAFYMYRAPRDVAQGRISAFTVANISVRQKFMDDKASLSLRVSDPFDQMGFRFEVDNDTFYQLGERKWESRRATLSFTYNFGEAPKQNRRRNQDAGTEGMDIGIN